MSFMNNIKKYMPQHVKKYFKMILAQAKENETIRERNDMAHMAAI